LRQAYDYWQDQPGNYGAKTITNQRTSGTGVPLCFNCFSPHTMHYKEYKAFELGVNLEQPTVIVKRFSKELT
jgi:hypothetical protein